MASAFCDLKTEGVMTECRRCGSINYTGHEPTCPPWVTRSEPDNKRLPHIVTQEDNDAAWQSWYDAETYKEPRTPVSGG